MGKGDKKSKKGKIFMGSYGVSRKKRVAKKIILPKAKSAAKVKEKPAKAVVAEEIKVVAETVETQVVEAPKKPKAKKETAKEAEPKKEKTAAKKTTAKKTTKE